MTKRNNDLFICLKSIPYQKFWRKITNKLKLQNNPIRNKRNYLEFIYRKIQRNENYLQKEKETNETPPTNPLSFLPIHLCTQLATIDLVYAYLSIATSILITISICSRWLSSWRNARVFDTGRKSTNRRRRKGKGKKEEEEKGRIETSIAIINREISAVEYGRSIFIKRARCPIGSIDRSRDRINKSRGEV